MIPYKNQEDFDDEDITLEEVLWNLDLIVSMFSFMLPLAGGSWWCWCVAWAYNVTLVAHITQVRAQWSENMKQTPPGAHYLLRLMWAILFWQVSCNKELLGLQFRLLWFVSLLDLRVYNAMCLNKWDQAWSAQVWIAICVLYRVGWFVYNVRVVCDVPQLVHNVNAKLKQFGFDPDTSPLWLKVVIGLAGEVPTAAEIGFDIVSVDESESDLMYVDQPTTEIKGV